MVLCDRMVSPYQLLELLEIENARYVSLLDSFPYRNNASGRKHPLLFTPSSHPHIQYCFPSLACLHSKWEEGQQYDCSVLLTVGKKKEILTCALKETLCFFLLQILGRQSGSAGIQVAELNETPHPLSYVWVKIDTVPKCLLTLTPLGPGLPSGPAKPYYKKTRVVLHLKQPDLLCLKGL